MVIPTTLIVVGGLILGATTYHLHKKKEDIEVQLIIIACCFIGLGIFLNFLPR